MSHGAICTQFVTRLLIGQFGWQINGESLSCVEMMSHSFDRVLIGPGKLKKYTDRGNYEKRGSGVVF